MFPDILFSNISVEKILPIRVPESDVIRVGDITMRYLFEYI